ncbi:MAG: aldehyde ferredoxin oxidoreductase C-terminal domain-containing protein, partial [Bacteroidota bacterium]|nr:aldehyde ferredoxin oxidoreductase C-terminal domain-containing protein [Bacteroidota bacterium]
SMGGAGIVFNNLGINLLSIVNKSKTPSILYLNRNHGEEIKVELVPIDIDKVWNEGKKGIYSLMDYTYKRFGDRFENAPRVLAVGPSARSTDFGAIGSAPIKKGEITPVDTWAGRGGFGTKMFRDHGIAAIIYGGTHIEDDFRDRKVADEWFQDKYQQKLAAKDVDSTTKYRYDPSIQTGGTFGVNYTSLKGRMISFNYKSMFMSEDERLDIHKKFVLDHYLKQFNEETIEKKQQANCGEPCAAVCKKMNGIYKKDYEPYQTMGPLSGIFDQRAAEKLNHHADALGFDAISVGGIISWLMDCIDQDYIKPEDLGLDMKPVFSLENFDVVKDSQHNADLGIQILDAIIDKKIDLSDGPRRFGRRLSNEKGKNLLNLFVYNSFARNGWSVPNQYWTPGALSPMAIMGKYYMYYGNDFIPPRELGRKDAERLRGELILDNIGSCRFHRKWAEEMMPDIIGTLFGLKEEFLASISLTASRINSRNSSMFWESERNIDFIEIFLKRRLEEDEPDNSELKQWVEYFEKDRKQAAMDFWYDMHKGIHESLNEFPE